MGSQASSLCLSCEPGWDAGLWWELGRREIRTFREGPLSVPGFGPLLILGKLGGFCRLLPSTHSNQDPPSACPPGFYGSGCQRVCECQQGASCDPVSGQCFCPAGFHGQFCEKGECQAPTQPLYPFLVLFDLGMGTRSLLPPPGCQPGFFGDGCQQQCDCQKGVPCDPASGLCLCPPGRTGATCDLGEWRVLLRVGPEGRSPSIAHIQSCGLGTCMPGLSLSTVPSCDLFSSLHPLGAVDSGQNMINQAQTASVAAEVRPCSVVV